MVSFEQLTQDVRLMQQTKQDKENFNEQRLEIQSMLDKLFGQMDGNRNKLMTMEHFIDKYVPIRI